MRVFCTVSGAPLCDPFVGHSADVTTVSFHPAHPDGQVLLTASLDGTLRTWNTQDGSMGMTLTAPGPVESMAVASRSNPHSRDTVYLSCWKRRREGDDGEGGRIHACKIGNKQSSERLIKVATPTQLIINPSGTLLGTFDRHTILIWLLSHKDCGTDYSQCLHRLHHTKRISVLACDMTGNVITAGDCTGRILLWRGILAERKTRPTQNDSEADLMSAENSLPCTTFHWHSRTVQCLSFTSDSAYLLSGGSEGVLVIWHLEDGQKSYLPRLGASLRGISPFPRDAARVAIACADNAVRLISISSMVVECAITGVMPAFFKPRYAASRRADLAEASRNNLRAEPSPAVSLEPRSGTIAFAAVGSSLQLYDHEHDRHVARLAIAPSNFVSSDGNSDEPMEPYVSHATFSRDGSILVTVDRKSEQTMSATDEGTFLSATLRPDETLRIWERQSPINSVKSEPSEGEFTCVCVCDAPHADYVTSTVIRGVAGEVSAMVCSVSVNGEVKLWIPTKFSNGGERAGWRCRSMMTHPGSPPPPVGAAAFSHDDSLVATACAEVIIWEPESCSLLHVLTPPTWDETLDPSSTQIITGLSFIADEPLLAAVSAVGLVIWNVMTLTVLRTIALSCADVVAHPTLPQFVVTTIPQSETCNDPVSLVRTRNTQRDSTCLNRTSGSLVVQYNGSEASPTKCWVTPGGEPQAVLYSSRVNGGIVIVTHNRRIVLVDTTMEDSKRAKHELSKLAMIRPSTATALRAFDTLQLTQRALKVYENTSGIGSSNAVGGESPWGELFNAPSHRLPPLTNLAPYFLDALLERRCSA